MKQPYCLLIFLIIAIAACKKRSINDGTCPVARKLTGVKSQGGVTTIMYNTDGTMKSVGGDIKWFNNGQLGEYVGATDTVVLDSIGRLLYFKQPFENSGRQTAKYFYDDRNRVVRTITNTGNGLDYLQDLTYQNGDVVNMAYRQGASSSPFYYSFYDTLCPHPYFALQSWSQIGTTQNMHLLKASWYNEDTTYYSYQIDSNNRILASYMNYDNSGWTPSRTTDTTYFIYSCN